MSSDNRRLCVGICTSGKNRVRPMTEAGIDRKQEDGRAQKVVAIAARSDQNPAVQALLDIEKEVWLRCLPGVTQAEVGRELGLSRHRVNRILKAAREKIRYMARLHELIQLEVRFFRRFLGLADGMGCPSDCPLRRYR